MAQPCVSRLAAICFQSSLANPVFIEAMHVENFGEGRFIFGTPFRRPADVKDVPVDIDLANLPALRRLLSNPGPMTRAALTVQVQYLQLVHP
jgi:hypothetical protein